jgi:ribose transport system ATP-binding protein
VLRDGKNAGQTVVSETKRSELIKMMVGREIGERFPALGQDIEEELLKVENLKVPDKIEKVNFTLHRGEVIGIAGLMGAGRTELAKSLFGVFKPTEGKITYKGEKLALTSPKEAIQKGIYYLSEDRKGEGLITILSVQDNITLSILREILKLKLFINSQTEKETALKYIKDLNIKTPSEKQLVKNLSGGNQQKVVVSKVLSTNPEIIIMDDPTRGIDVGAKQEIYEIIKDLIKEKVGIILISSELPEVINMSHQIIVLHEKMMKGMINSDKATQQNIMELATGGGKSG